MPRCLSLLTFLFSTVVLAGCTEDSSTPAGAAASAPAPQESVAPPARIEEVVDLADSPENRQRLQDWALSEAVSVEVRYAALRHLEELQAPETVDVALQLARSQTKLLSQNAVAVLVRLDTPEARDPLNELGPEEQALAKALLARRSQ